MNKIVISTTEAPSAIGPYSQGIATSELIFTSGQIPINPSDSTMVTDDIKKATAQSLENIKAILEEAGSSLYNVLNTTVLLKDIDDFAEMNEVYATYFKENPPARSCFQVGKLPKDALVEIEAIALK
jgi:2-iminobutanoate/2-iminopropanoate deaminase